MFHIAIWLIRITPLHFENEAMKMIHCFHLNVWGTFKVSCHFLATSGTKASQNWNDLTYLFE